MAVYSSLSTLVHRQICGWLTLDKPAGGLSALILTNERQPVSTNHRAGKVPGGREREREN